MEDFMWYYFGAVILLLDNWFSVLSIAVLMAIPLVVIEWFCRKVTPAVKRGWMALMIPVIVLMGAYHPSWTFASMNTAFYDTSAEIQLAAKNEYWYHLYVDPFFPKDCYTSNSQKDCEIWSKHFVWESMSLETRLYAFIVPILFGLLTAWISVGIKRVIKYLLSRYAHVQWS
jgi:hypothetical protein